MNGVTRNWPLSLLGDGIYPECVIFVGPNHYPRIAARTHMMKIQEATRNSMDQLFGCLQGPFKILHLEFFEWDVAKVVLIWEVRVIVHNDLVGLRGRSDVGDEIDANGQHIAGEAIVPAFVELPSSVAGSQ